METNFENKWNLWYHSEKDNWKISGYRNIYTINNFSSFWKLYNNWDKLGGITSKHFFLMKESINPIWEDDNNIKGGCWSFKVSEYQAKELWEDLSMYLVSEHLSVNKDDVVGLSICLKKNYNVVIKIWNKTSKNNSLKNLNEKILKKWGMDVIYIAHMPDTIN
jgi:hypothetical protein